MANNSLKPFPCPCCGGKAEIHLCAELENTELRAIYANKVGVHCSKCNLATPPYDNEKSAVEAWNKRVSRNCPFCGCPTTIYDNEEDVSGAGVWWKKKCLNCDSRFEVYEPYENESNE